MHCPLKMGIALLWFLLRVSDYLKYLGFKMKLLDNANEIWKQALYYHMCLCAEIISQNIIPEQSNDSHSVKSSSSKHSAKGNTNKFIVWHTATELLSNLLRKAILHPCE